MTEPSTDPPDEAHTQDGPSTDSPAEAPARAGPAVDSAPEASTGGGLALRRNAGRGFALAALVAAAVFVFFAAVPGTRRPLVLYVGLAAVLGVSLGLLATAVLVGWRVRRLTRGR